MPETSLYWEWFRTRILTSLHRYIEANFGFFVSKLVKLTCFIQSLYIYLWFNLKKNADSYAAKLVMNEGESVYDFCWYPYMSASGASIISLVLVLWLLCFQLNLDWFCDWLMVFLNGNLIWGLIDISDPVSCVFASTARDHPIHLWDATSGEVLSSYCWYAFY